MAISGSSKTRKFQDMQYLFTQHMRDPRMNPAPKDIEARRMKIYSDLIFNNIESFMANSFPVIRQITSDEKWRDMIRDYVTRHEARTPFFPKMPQEFLEYLKYERLDDNEDYPFLLELGHYEWVEMSIDMDTREFNFNKINKEGDLLTDIPVMSQLVLPLIYDWPVHRISPSYLPTEKPDQPTYILLYRRLNHEVSFMILNNVSARLVEKLKNNNESGQDILHSIAKELNHPDPNLVIKGGLKILQDFKDKDIILGTKGQV